MWRKMVIDGIRQDPDWKNGEYTTEPQQALRTWMDFLLIAGGAPHQLQKSLPTRDAVDKSLEADYKTRLASMDANDILYQVNSSRNYDPSTQLEKIVAPVMWINSADDFINPPELGSAEQEVKKIPHAKFILIPISDQTRGHGTHTAAAIWKDYLAEFMRETEPK